MQCKIADRSLVAPDIFQLTLKSCDEKQVPFDFHAGQYALISIPGQDEHAARPYSIASRPGLETISFHIKDMDRGLSHALLNLSTDQTITLDFPHGDAHYRASDRPVLMVAGGLGLAPLISILEQMKVTGDKARHVYLYHGTMKAADLYMDERLSDMARQWPVLKYFGVTEEADHHHPQGRIGDFVAAAHDNLSNFDAYLSGPPVMVTHAFSLLQDKGLKLSRTYSDALHHDIKTFAKS